MADLSGGSGALSYEAAGVDIDAADALKRRFDGVVSSEGVPHCAPTNRVGAFASLVDIDLSRWPRPLFVLKTEEPGSKQVLSVEHGRLDWLAQDLINHLVNDVAVMGATPCAVLDTIICGKLDQKTVYGLVSGMAAACRDNGCVLVGGETSEQPGVLPDGRYILQASMLGVVDKDGVIDGEAVREGDAVVALASNGLHTNGYSLVRRLMEERPEAMRETVGGEPFMDALLKPHVAYYPAIRQIVGRFGGAVHGMAHITGGGIRDNLARVIRNDALAARIDCASLRMPTIFHEIRRHAGLDDAQMLRTFNCGAGLVVVVDAVAADAVAGEARAMGVEAYPVGSIVRRGSGGSSSSGSTDGSDGSGGSVSSGGAVELVGALPT